MKVSELPLVKLNYWMAKAIDKPNIKTDGCGRPYTSWYDDTVQPGSNNCKEYFEPTTNWSQLGPLIEKYWMGIRYWMTVWFGRNWHDMFPVDEMRIWFCRAIVASVYGEEVDDE